MDRLTEQPKTWIGPTSPGSKPGNHRRRRVPAQDDNYEKELSAALISGCSSLQCNLTSNEDPAIGHPWGAITFSEFVHFGIVACAAAQSCPQEQRLGAGSMAKPVVLLQTATANARAQGQNHAIGGDLLTGRASSAGYAHSIGPHAAALSALELAGRLFATAADGEGRDNSVIVPVIIAVSGTEKL
eukprot:Skav204510  [mRNA]  locus=scaffold527:379950:391391:- [translate_table: standard]